MRVAFFRASAGRSPFAARIARATARSKAVPDFGRSAGARFTTTFFGGTGNPTCRSAERTRSRHSFTAASGRPTIVRPGRPAPIAASTTTVRPSRPDTVAEYARATIIVPASVHDGEREDERLSGLERVGRTYAVLAPNLVDAHAVARGDREERVASLHDVADETRRGRGLGRGCCGRVDEPLRGNRDSGGRRLAARRSGRGGNRRVAPDLRRPRDRGRGSRDTADLAPGWGRDRHESLARRGRRAFARHDEDGALPRAGRAGQVVPVAQFGQGDARAVRDLLERFASLDDDALLGDLGRRRKRREPGSQKLGRTNGNAQVVRRDAVRGRPRLELAVEELEIGQRAPREGGHAREVGRVAHLHDV